jgi:hypothetical protein
VDSDVFRRVLRSFSEFAIGKKPLYNEEKLRIQHAPMHITHREFDRMKFHLLEELKALSYTPE